MLTFQRQSTLKEIRSRCRRRDWKLRDTEFERGSDYVSIAFKYRRVFGVAVCSLVTGEIFGTLEGGAKFHVNDADFDSFGWGRALLNVIYT